MSSSCPSWTSLPQIVSTVSEYGCCPSVDLEDETSVLALPGLAPLAHHRQEHDGVATVHIVVVVPNVYVVVIVVVIVVIIIVVVVVRVSVGAQVARQREGGGQEVEEGEGGHCQGDW